MRLIPVKTAAISLAAGLLATVIPAGPASAAGPGHRVLLSNGRYAYTTQTPATPSAQARASTGFRPKLMRDGRLLARPASLTPDASTGSISGRVTGGGHPLRGICVEAYGSGTSSDGTFVTTSKAGRYRLPGLRPGRYYFAFFADERPCRNKGNWLVQWYRGIDSLSPTTKAVQVHVRAGHDTQGIDASLHHGGQISGVVHDPSGKPLSGICVLAGAIDQRVVARTNAEGHYAIGGLYPNSYEVVFYLGCGTKGNYEPQWWPNTSANHAKTVKVTGHRVTAGIDAVMRPGAGVTGTVRTQDAGHQPLNGACLNAISDSGIFTFFGPPEPTATTGKDGRFELKGMTAGHYTVAIDPTCVGRRASRYLPTSRSLRVKTGKVRRGFRILLQPSAGASGRVTDSHGRPIKGICVLFEGESKHTKTGADGRYRITGLHLGKFPVEFTGGCGNTESVISQYYKDRPDLQSATQINFKPGKIATGISAVMQPGASVAGTVTDKSGHPLSHQCVHLITPQDSQSIGLIFSPVTSTSADGHYRFKDLTPGPYQVVAGCGRHALSWFSSAPDSTTASFLSTMPGVTTTVDFKLGLAGSISGTITDAAGHPLGEICAFAANPKTKLLINVTSNPGMTGTKGQYHLDGLSPGKYIVTFTDCHDRARFGTQWYNHRTTTSFATPVTVRAGKHTTGIDATMRTGATIAGTVTGPGGRPASRICVQASDPATLAFAEARTNAQGQYSMSGLGTGRYSVYFAPCGNRSPNLGGVSAPSPVRVTAPRPLTVNVRLKPGGSISGLVLGGRNASTPQFGACAQVVPNNPDGSQQFAFANAKGKYLLRGLAPGTYRVYLGDIFCTDNEFPPPDAPQWYSDQPTPSTATSIKVSAGRITTGIDAKLVPSGVIEGSVTNLGLAGLGRECVTAFPFDAKPDPFFETPVPPEVAISTPSGHFALTGLQPGQYKVKFSSGCGRTGFADQWWDNATSPGKAKIINLGFTDIGGIDARLKGH